MDWITSPFKTHLHPWGEFHSTCSTEFLFLHCNGKMYPEPSPQKNIYSGYVWNIWNIGSCPDPLFPKDFKPVEKNPGKVKPKENPAPLFVTSTFFIFLLHLVLLPLNLRVNATFFNTVTMLILALIKMIISISRLQPHLPRDWWSSPTKARLPPSIAPSSISSPGKSTLQLYVCAFLIDLIIKNPSPPSPLPLACIDGKRWNGTAPQCTRVTTPAPREHHHHQHHVNDDHERFS